MTFESLQIKPEIIKALKDIGITSPTMIQRKAIPLIIAGKDIIGISKTGSGKTAAFGVPLMHKIIHGKGIQALVMAPTRELAVQIAHELHKFGKHSHADITAVYGGVSLGPQMDNLRKTDIVVGTPGRLLDHIQRRTIDLSHVNYLVLDEADKMVDMGFIDDIKRILSFTPKTKQMLLFGATISREIEDIKHRYMNNPATVEAEKHVEEDLLKQYYYDLKPNEKFSYLIHLIKKEKVEKAIVFCSTRSTVQMVAKNLRQQGIKADMLHGKLSQNKRQNVIDSFTDGRFPILVASAVAARGLHVDDVSHIFNFDLSRDPEEYIHRVGRTARAGASGKAITLLGPRDHDTFRDIISRFPVKVEKLPVEPFEQIHFQAKSSHEGRGFGDRQGFRGGRGQGRPQHGRFHSGGSRFGGHGRSSSSNSSGGYRPRHDPQNDTSGFNRN